MAFHFGGRIVKDGLRVYLDAGNPESYIPNSTIWQDMSENRYSGELLNGPTFVNQNTGYISFDGSNDWFYLNPESAGSDTGIYTVEVWCLSSLNSSGFQRGNDGFGNGWNFSIGTFNYGDGTIRPYVALNGDLPFDTITWSNNSIPNNTWVNVVGVWRPTISLDLYLNGIFENTTNTPTITTLRSSTLGWIMGRQGSGYYQPRISIAKVYDRALSAQEVLQNYNALKGRYGL